MTEQTEAVKVMTVDDLFAILAKDCIGNEKIEAGMIVTNWSDEWGIETDGFKYADEDLYVTKWRNRIYLIIGEQALQAHNNSIKKIMKEEEEVVRLAEETKRKDIEQATRLLARYGLSVAPTAH